MKRIWTIWLVGGLVACSNNDGKKQQTGNEPQPRRADTSHKAPVANVKNIIFFGNSITAGYGVEPTEAFPARIGEKLDSLKLPYRVINAGLSGETTAGGRNRVDWVLRQPVDVFVLELGGNDGLRGIPIIETRQNLQAIIDKVREKNPQAIIILAGMQVPPNMGSRYAGEFRNTFRELAEKNKIPLIPFILEGVGGVQHLNQADGIHPTPEGHRIVAENVWEVLKQVL